MTQEQYENFGKLDRFIKAYAPLAPTPPERHELAATAALALHLKTRTQMFRFGFAALTVAASISLVLWKNYSHYLVPQKDLLGDVLSEVIDNYGQNLTIHTPVYDDWDLLAEGISSNDVRKP